MKLAVSKTDTIVFTTHVNQHMNALKAYCRSLTKSSWDADDLIQETLLKAFKSWKKNPRDLSKAFFFRIASNTWIDQYRKKTLPIEENQEINELKHEVGMRCDDDRRILEHALKKLSPKQRAILLLTEGLRLSAGEAAHIMGESVGAVKAALHRARRKLKDVEIDTLSESDDESMISYISALNEGLPESIVQLYQRETGAPMMSLSTQNHLSISLACLVVGQNGSSYVLITVTLKNGKQITMPFYRKEWLAMVAYLNEECETYALTA